MTLAARISAFTGARPKIDKRLLQDGMAQDCENLILTSGRLDPLYTPLQLVATRSGTIKSIYRMYDSSGDDYWLNWTSDVDVVRGPVAGDTSFRIYYTSDEFEPRTTNLALATTAAPYPTACYVLGVTPPTTAPAVSSTGGVSGTTETRAYVYTFVTAWGEESAPSPASSAVTGKIDDTWTVASMQTAPANSYATSAVSYAAGYLTVTVGSTFGLRAGEYVTLAALAPAVLNASWKVYDVPSSTTFRIAMSSPGAITDQVGTATRDAPHNTSGMFKRVYRSVTANGATDYYLVVDNLAVATTSTTDTATTIGEPCPTTGWIMPPVGLQGLRVLPSGALVGFSANSVYFSEPYAPYAWPLAYRLTVDFPIVGIGVFGQTVVILTSGQPYATSGADPASMSSPAKIDQNWPCLAKRGIAEFSGQVVYPTTLGLASIGPAGAQLLTQDLYSQIDWAVINHATFTAAHYDNRYYTHVAYDTVDKTLIISNDIGVVSLGFQPTALFNDPSSGALYAAYGGYIYKWNASTGVYSTFSWTSKEYLVPEPVNIGAARLDATFTVSAADIAAAAAANDAIIAANAVRIAAGTVGGSLNKARVNGLQVNGSLLRNMNSVEEASSVTVQLYVDSTLYHSAVVSTSSIFRLPATRKYDNFYWRLTGNIPIRSLVYGETPLSLKQV